MAITLDDILAIEPSTVSRDLSSYITYIYGSPKVGKTTLAKDMGALILSFEDGTRAMTGAYRTLVKNWGDIRAIARYAKEPRFKERYHAIAVDTVDLAASLCEKYICQQNNVDAIGKVPFGGGWSQFKKEFEEVFRGITMEGFAVLFISHDKTKEITRPNGTTYTKTVPTVSESINNIVMNMSDIIGYAYQDFETDKRWLILRGGNDIAAGTRFPYMESKIEFGYQSLVDALNRAIDKEAEVSGAGSVVDTKNCAIEAEVDYNYDDLMAEFQTMVGELMAQDQTYYAPRVTQIVERTFGKGHKISEATLDQAELVYYVIKEIRETLVQGKKKK